MINYEYPPLGGGTGIVGYYLLREINHPAAEPTGYELRPGPLGE